MKVLLPNYYENFRCIADKCRHSCCIGWEIDIDPETLTFYEGLDSPLGDKIRKNISYEGEPHLILGEGERCPFLEDDGLCEIIRRMGEEATCSICRDHPRFRSFYEDFTELGLGLSCEEAARVILGFKEPFALLNPSGERLEMTCEEREALAEREKVISLLTNRDMSILRRFKALGESFGFALSDIAPEKTRGLYMSLERLDNSWTEKLAKLSEEESVFSEEEFKIPFEQLAVYFIYRHFTNAFFEGMEEGAVRLSVSACLLIGAMLSFKRKVEGEISLSDMVELCRMYSSEVEYSEENTEALLSSL